MRHVTGLTALKSFHDIDPAPFPVAAVGGQFCPEMPVFV
jgi:hypothetical protein